MNAQIRPATVDATTGADAIDLARFIDHRPVSAFQWGIVGLCMVAVILDGFDLQTIGIVAPALAQSWGMTPRSFSTVFAAAPAGMMLGALSMGLLADRVGRKAIIVASIVMFGLCSLLAAFATNLPQLIVLRLATGIGLGGLLPNLASLVPDYSPQRLRGTLMTLSFGLLPFGSMLGGLLGNWLIPRYGWPSVFYIGGIAPLIVATLALFSLPESLRFLGTRGDKPDLIRRILLRMDPGMTLAADARFTVPEHGTGKASFGRLLGPDRTIPLVLLSLAFGMIMFMVNFCVNWLPILFKRAGLPDDVAILSSALFSVGGGVGAFMWGPLIDRLGAFRVMMWAGICCAVSFVALAQGYQQPTVRAIALIAVGWCILGAMPGLYALIGSVFPTAIRSTGVGAVFGLGRIGSILGPIAGGALVGMAMPIHSILLIVAVPGVLLALFVWHLGRIPRDFR